MIEKMTTCLRSLCILELTSMADAREWVQPVPLEQVCLLVGPFKRIQDLHRTGVCSILGAIGVVGIPLGFV